MSAYPENCDIGLKVSRKKFKKIEKQCLVKIGFNPKHSQQYQILRPHMMWMAALFDAGLNKI